MADRPQTITLFLMDGERNGRVRCNISNWNGIAYKIPRDALDKFIDPEKKELSQSGVYFLFGNSEDQHDSPAVYIGQAGVRKNGGGILHRLQEHKNKDFWTEAVVFTTSDNTLGLTEISYLENCFCKLAIDIKRYEIKNNNDPTAGNITEDKKHVLEVFVEYAKIVMGTLGYMLFEPLAHTQKSKPAKEQLFYIKSRDADAKGRLTSKDEIIVLKGSVIRKNLTPCCPNDVKKLRKENKKNIGENNILLNDILFLSPSSASKFVLGTSSDGRRDWKTKDGKKLKDVE
jgi:hypothetical protein